MKYINKIAGGAKSVANGLAGLVLTGALAASSAGCALKDRAGAEDFFISISSVNRVERTVPVYAKLSGKEVKRVIFLFDHSMDFARAKMTCIINGVEEQPKINVPNFDFGEIELQSPVDLRGKRYVIVEEPILPGYPPSQISEGRFRYSERRTE